MLDTNDIYKDNHNLKNEVIESSRAELSGVESGSIELDATELSSTELGGAELSRNESCSIDLGGVDLDSSTHSTELGGTESCIAESGVSDSDGVDSEKGHCITACLLATLSEPAAFQVSSYYYYSYVGISRCHCSN